MQRIDMKIICPYFKTTARHNICCDGIDGRIEASISRFKSLADRNEFIRDFCASGCWEGCPVAAAIEENMYCDG